MKQIMSEASNKDLKSHWNSAYEHTATDSLGWYEEKPLQSLQLIEKTGLPKDAMILNVGAGSTTLVDELLDLGYKNIIASDISESALEKLKFRLGNHANQVRWIVDDLTNPTDLNKLGKIDLWHDRAVLHFFNDPEEQKTYFDLLRQLVRKGGYVIIAEFNLDGATMCSGLPVFRYNEEMIQDRLGPEFELIEAFNHTYTTPTGNSREYVYTLFTRT